MSAHANFRLAYARIAAGEMMRPYSKTQFKLFASFTECDIVFAAYTAFCKMLLIYKPHFK